MKYTEGKLLERVVSGSSPDPYISLAVVERETDEETTSADLSKEQKRKKLFRVLETATTKTKVSGILRHTTFSIYAMQ